ncbi:UNVERIFIED_CONTAM: hypothetical protein FKN15_022386 [Acipenser sinensis]
MDLTATTRRPTEEDEDGDPWKPEAEGGPKERRPSETCTTVSKAFSYTSVFQLVTSPYLISDSRLSPSLSGSGTRLLHPGLDHWASTPSGGKVSIILEWTPGPRSPTRNQSQDSWHRLLKPGQNLLKRADSKVQQRKENAKKNKSGTVCPGLDGLAVHSRVSRKPAIQERGGVIALMRYAMCQSWIGGDMIELAIAGVVTKGISGNVTL